MTLSKGEHGALSAHRTVHNHFSPKDFCPLRAWGTQTVHMHTYGQNTLPHKVKNKQKRFHCFLRRTERQSHPIQALQSQVLPPSQWIPTLLLSRSAPLHISCIWVRFPEDCGLAIWTPCFFQAQHSYLPSGRMNIPLPLRLEDLWEWKWI